MSKTGNVEGVTRKKDAAQARPPHGLSHANVLLVQASGTCGISSRCCSKAGPEQNESDSAGGDACLPLRGAQRPTERGTPALQRSHLPAACQVSLTLSR